MNRFLIFILLSFGQVWALFGILKLADASFSMNPGEFCGALYLYGAGIPSLSAMLATALTGKMPGLRTLFRRSFQWRFSWCIYLVAVLTPLVVKALNAAIAVVINGPAFPKIWFSPILGMGYIFFFLIYNGLGEEIGWRGLGLQTLQQRLGSLGGNLIVGVIWAVWHLPLFFMEGSLQYGDSIVAYIFLLTCWSIIMGALVNRGHGSILPAILFHESANFIAFTLHIPGSGYGLLIWGLAAGIAIVFLPSPFFAIPWKARQPLLQ